MTGVERIAAERKRQIDVEGYDSRHDDYYDNDQLALAAACYAIPEDYRRDMEFPDDYWFLEWARWKPTPGNRIRELEKAGALIAAEIDRLLRLEARNG